MSGILRWLACLVFVLAIIAPARAEKVGAIDDLTLSPYFFIKGGDPSVDQLPLKETNVVVNISGVVADVHITQKSELFTRDFGEISFKIARSFFDT